MCNKLASRHVRVGLAEPSNAPCCDICENAPGIMIYFFIEFATFDFLNFFLFLLGSLLLL